MTSSIPGRPVRWTPAGASDAGDGTNAFPGAMALLQNLVPDPTTRGRWVPRPAAIGIVGSGANPTLWGGFNWGGANWGGFGNIPAAAQGTALLVLGNIIYGMIASTTGTYAGKDVPFALNKITKAFLPISIPGGAASLPATQPTTGDWTPPTMQPVGSRIMLTHPGFPGGSGAFIGWLDVSGFSNATLTASTHSSTTLDTFSANPLQAGVQPGMTVTGAGIPANTTVVSVTASAVTISQAATASSAGVALTFAGGTAAAPLWGSGNTNTHALTAVPVAVYNFNGRAYYAVPGNGLQFSDAGAPCQITNATQGLNPQNGLDVTALGGLAFGQTTGGPLQALIAFQGDAQMQSITGDPVTSNLAINGLGNGVGTLAPNTIFQSPRGLGFIAPDGLRFVTFLQSVTDPIGIAGDGICEPFLNAVNPSRMCAAYNQDVVRASVQNGAATGQPVQEWWYHLSRKRWSGPHTFPASLIQPAQLDENDFVMFAYGIPAELWDSDVVPSTASTYTENGNPMTCQWQTVLLPDNGDMTENAVVETTLGLQLPANSSAAVQAQNEAGIVLGTVTVAGPSAPASNWGSVNWGGFAWGGQQGFFAQYDVPWTQALVFKQASFTVTATAVAGLAIGNLYFKARALGYRMQAMGGVAVSGGYR